MLITNDHLLLVLFKSPDHTTLKLMQIGRSQGERHEDPINSQVEK